MIVPRGVDALGLPDNQLREDDKAYLEKHCLDGLVNGLLTNLIKHKPLDPVQYIIDMVEYNEEYAKQDLFTGLPEHRKAKLLDVFRIMDKEGHGRISFKGLAEYASKYGGETLHDDDLQSIFKDFHPTHENLISPDEFLAFFAKVSRIIPNAEFDTMIKELQE